VGKVTKGRRPQWPHDNPSQWLVDELRAEIEACWSPDPKKRPTVLMVLELLQALSQERVQQKPRESQELLEYHDEDTWDHMDDAPELGTPRPPWQSIARLAF
jgi:hypothetical protein